MTVATQNDEKKMLANGIKLHLGNVFKKLAPFINFKCIFLLSLNSTKNLKKIYKWLEYIERLCKQMSSYYGLWWWDNLFKTPVNWRQNRRGIFSLLSSQRFKQILWSLPLSSIILKEQSVNIFLKIIQLHKFLREIWNFKTMKTHYCLFKALLLLLSRCIPVRLWATP